MHRKFVTQKGLSLAGLIFFNHPNLYAYTSNTKVWNRNAQVCKITTPPASQMYRRSDIDVYIHEGESGRKPANLSRGKHPADPFRIYVYCITVCE